MGFCFPGDNVYVYEYPSGFRFPTKQKRYGVVDFNSRTRVETQHDTTYYGSLATEAPTRNQRDYMPAQGVSSCLSLLRVNSTFRRVGPAALYGKTFHFRCMAHGVRMFLEAHPKSMRLAREVVLYYHCRYPDNAVSPSNNSEWQGLLRCIRHKCSFLPRIKLQVGEGFWRDISWSDEEKKAERSPTSLLSRTGSFKEFDKIAAPAERWFDTDDPETHEPRCRDGTALELAIKGTEDDAKAEFVAQLAAVLEEKRAIRPLFYVSPKGR